MIGLANWVLGRIFGAREREGGRYGTGIVCWQQIVLGGMGRGREEDGWEGSVESVRRFFKNSDVESEGKKYKSLFLYLRIWYAVSKKLGSGCLKDLKPAQDRTP